MKRGTIRDNRSERKVKPRAMDYIRDDNGQEILEVKDGNVKKTILILSISLYTFSSRMFELCSIQ